MYTYTIINSIRIYATFFVPIEPGSDLSACCRVYAYMCNRNAELGDINQNNIFSAIRKVWVRIAGYM